MIRNILILILALCYTCPVSALTESEQARKTLALSYLQAYVNLNFTVLSRFYSESSTWRDISANAKHSGTRDIIEFLQKSTVGITDYRFIPDQIYIGSSSVSLIGSYEIETEGTLYGKPGKHLIMVIPGITILTISTKNNLVSEHIDILDYTSMKEQLEKY